MEMLINQKLEEIAQRYLQVEEQEILMTWIFEI